MITIEKIRNFIQNEKYEFYTHAIIEGKKDRVENPSDYNGVVSIPFDDAGGWKLKLAKELKEIFSFIDLNKIV